MAYTYHMITSGPVTVIETPSFLRDRKKLLEGDERVLLENYRAGRLK
ncbi:hypothetical protein TREPR_2615 [Treponema primitia ZAS-2]|uniref:Uncharacterized protein n=1 Tax=Treponema primitia (strain ATCC BAA-887 / DSM 12427 / ZAS-2) TaxID=545694 RepID=F5YRB6_TREPZ|nr:hypothetical protein TREPR_2615 [Treponema primitia ZAS-2]